jgi:hypothetical protein
MVQMDMNCYEDTRRFGVWTEPETVRPDLANNKLEVIDGKEN